MNVSSRFDVAGFGAIVTGGASGLGLAYGEVLAAHGARVTLIDVDAGAVAAQAARLQDEGLDVRCCVVSHIKLWPRTNTSDGSQLHKVRVHPLLPLPKSRLRDAAFGGSPRSHRSGFLTTRGILETSCS